MVRMQVQFSEEEVTALRRTAAERHVSISAVVREAVEANVVRQGSRDRAAAVARAKAVMGKYSSGLGHLASRHDDFIAEAIDS